MEKIFTWSCFLLVAFNAVIVNTENQNNNFLQLEDQLDPVQQVQLGNVAFESDEDRGDREKRFGIIKKIGLKAGLLHFVFGKIDSFIDAKTRAINEIDKQNIIKNEKYFGITYPPKEPQNNLVGNLLTIKKNLIGSAVSSFIQSKFSGGGSGGGSHPGY